VKTSGDRFHVALEAEKGFDPAKDVDPKSLRLGAPSKVDLGKTGASLSVKVNAPCASVAQLNRTSCRALAPTGDLRQ